MNYNNLLKQAQAHYDSVKDAADVEPAILMAGFAREMYDAGQRAERERIAGLEEFIRSLESFQSKTLDGYTYHDGFGEEMKEICDMRTKSVLGSGRDLLDAFDAVPNNFK